jgi:predicted methyltransferase
MLPDISWSRRGVIVGAAATGLVGCGRKKVVEEAPKAPAKKGAETIEAAVAGGWRSPADKARDIWRHPAETLKFWELKPGQTVVEFWPGAGWYTEILAPFLADTNGKLYAATLEADPNDPAAAEIVEA